MVAQVVAPVEASTPTNDVATQAHKPQRGLPTEDDLNNWSHHFSTDTINDPCLQKAVQGTNLVTFVFGLEASSDLTKKHNQIDLDPERAEGEKTTVDKNGELM